MNEVKTILLQGAVEVVAEVETFPGYWRLWRPLRILPVPLIHQTPQGLTINVAMQMIPLTGSTIQAFVDVSPSDMVGEPMDTAKAQCDAYMQQTSGIQIAH